MPGYNPFDPTQQGSPSAAPVGSTSGVSLNPDGTINYGALPGGGTSNKAIPTNPDTGALDLWSYVLPPELTGVDPATHKQPTIYLGDQYANTSQTTMRGTGEDRTKVNINQPHSFHNDMSASEVMDFFQKMAYSQPGQFSQVSKLLADGNFYGTTPKAYGGFDDTTQKALGTAMVQYLQATQGGAYGGSFLDFLVTRAQQLAGANGGPLSSAAGGGSGGGLSSRPELTDPDTLSLYAQKAAQAALGRNLSKTELQSFIDQFHNQQQSSYETALHGNGPMTDKNDPRASAVQFVTKSNPSEFQQHQIQGYTDAFLNMFLPNQSAAPNMNVDPASVGY